jgi:septal ring factor EnvC (AmiA/AmiB activator)
MDGFMRLALCLRQRPIRLMRSGLMDSRALAVFNLRPAQGTLFPGNTAQGGMHSILKKVEQTVRNIHEVLKQKEAECDELRHEIDALRIVIPLLDEKAASQRIPSGEEAAKQAEPSMRAPEEREVREAEPAAAELDVDRKGPLSASLNSSSWWKRAK